MIKRKITNDSQSDIDRIERASNALYKLSEKESSFQRVNDIMTQRERILEAFIAETGLLPSQCEQVEERRPEGFKWYIRKNLIRKGEIVANPETHQRIMAILKKAQKYIDQTHDEAQSKHDNYGDSYMDEGLWETMQDTMKISKEIDDLMPEPEE